MGIEGSGEGLASWIGLELAFGGGTKEGGLNLIEQGTLPVGAQLGLELFRMQFLKSLLPSQGLNCCFRI